MCRQLVGCASGHQLAAVVLAVYLPLVRLATTDATKQLGAYLSYPG